jgi:hypothetical protein
VTTDILSNPSSASTSLDEIRALVTCGAIEQAGPKVEGLGDLSRLCSDRPKKIGTKLVPRGESGTNPRRRKVTVCRVFFRVSDGTRTRDRLDHNQELYLLSYAHHAAALWGDVRNLAVGSGSSEAPR